MNSFVPPFSIAMMLLSAVICIGLPVALFLIARKKYGAKLVPALVGIAGFVLFALVLESLLHQLVLKPDATGAIALVSRHPWLFVLYGAMAAGVFEETARFLGFLLLRKKYRCIGTAISYGIGHGGIESVLLGGVAMVSNIAVSILLNNNAMPPVAGLDIGALATTPPLMFLLGAVERTGAVAIHISLSALVYYAVLRRDSRWLYPLAILLHALIDVPAAMMQAGLLSSILLVEVLVYVCAALLVVLAVRVHRKRKDPDPSSEISQ